MSMHDICIKTWGRLVSVPFFCFHLLSNAVYFQVRSFIDIDVEPITMIVENSTVIFKHGGW